MSLIRAKYNEAWDLRDRRVDDWPLMSSPCPTMVICATYVYLVKVWGPNYMKDRPAKNLRTFLIGYNVFQVSLDVLDSEDESRSRCQDKRFFNCQEFLDCYDIQAGCTLRCMGFFL